MKLKFDSSLDYQLEAIKSVTELPSTTLSISPRI